MVADNSISAVLTGDLVGSRKVASTSLRRAMDRLEEAARQFGHDWTMDLRFTRYRGDGWQVLLSQPNLVLHATLHFHACLRAADIGLDTRISAGVGTVATVGTANLNDASGVAFFISGDHLDRAKKRRFLIAGTGIGDWQASIFHLAEQLALGWTAAQAEVVALALSSELTQDEIARRIGVSRQAIQSRLASSGFSALDEALGAFGTYNFKSGGSSHD
jgi:predicted DNA-binding protein (UPF0251 family)